MSSISWIATVSVISTISRSAMPGCARISDSIDADHSGSIVVSGEMLRLSCTFGDHQFEHAVIHEADQAKLLGNRHDIGRQQHLPVILLHPDQALIKCRVTG